MGNYENLKKAVSDVIKTNGKEEITGAILQNTLLSIISTVGANATFAGIATPTTNPGMPDENVFYLASESGVYVNFGGVELKGEVFIFTNKNGTWKKYDSGISTSSKVLELEKNTSGEHKSFNFSSENYIASFSDVKLTKEVEYIVYAETNIGDLIALYCNKKYDYVNDEYYESGKYPLIRFVDGIGSVRIKNNSDTDLGSWGFQSSNEAKTGIVNFTIYTSNSLRESINNTNEEIDAIKGNKQLYKKTFNFSKTATQINLGFDIKANKKYVLNVICNENYNTSIYGNPKLNYLNGIYYENGNYPTLKVYNGKGILNISNNTDTALTYFGFPSSESAEMYKGEYIFTLVELSENANNLSSLRESIDNINTEIAAMQSIDKSSGFIRIFHSMGVIGDSLSSGEIVTGNGTDSDPYVFSDRYNFSWLANIARKYGAAWRCFSNGGQTAKGWLTRWLPTLTSEENKRSLYFIALGTNDESKIKEGQLVLGTKDSNSNEESFAGYYKKIIESVHSYSEHSIIMCCTTYVKKIELSQIDNLIKEISDLYDYCYFINITQKSTFTLGIGGYMRVGHFDTIGYVKIADAIEILVNDVVEENKSKFSTWGVYAPD